MLSPIEKTEEWIRAKRASLSERCRGGSEDYSGSTLEVALSTVRDIARYARAGNQAMAWESRRTLNELCCGVYDGVMGYPAPVREALRAAGLRETA